MNRSYQKGCVVITGSSKGIGFGLAQAFLKLNYNVVISGRNKTQLDVAFAQLIQNFSESKILAIRCDITQHHDLKALWKQATQQFKQVDIWINNAGTCTATLDFINIPESEINNTIQTNILGTTLASQVALQGMIQQKFGQIYNMEGWGSKGEWSAGMTVYSTTKYAVSYFSKALFKEAKSHGIRIGTLSPGMVSTDLLISSWTQGNVQNWKKMKRLFLFIIDPPETVCKFLAHKIKTNKKSYNRIVWMTPLRLLFRLFQPYYWKRNPIQNTDLEHLDH
ncbi:SDR family NAD(P)-dependent oxidoreductase [Acinetobacter equi]|uniref:Oxidoreductase n=1 Tax=Acinetobacter equi TaxID=1324350 RepID=A0A0N9V6S2_9GAMM|nr:SDR family oxidoreductase [Acinetobacter equi]ALH94919.1 oxidoreductase [Acinetobacter equi]